MDMFAAFIELAGRKIGAAIAGLIILCIVLYVIFDLVLPYVKAGL